MRKQQYKEQTSNVANRWNESEATVHRYPLHMRSTCHDEQCTFGCLSLALHRR